MSLMRTAKYFHDLQTKVLHDKILVWGATLVGFADVSEGLAHEFKFIPRAISIAISHPDISQGIVKKDGIVAYNNQFPEIDKKLETILQKIVVYIRSMGWRALAIPPDTDRRDIKFISRLYPLFQHKTAATCSGLGWIGKNGLLINGEYGARLSWATVLTNAPVDTASTPNLRGQCGACSKCVHICPACAIRDEEWERGTTIRPKINVTQCGKQLEKNNSTLGQYICGLCIIACPYGRGEGVT